MTSGQKTALSLLVSILVFAGCVAYALLGGFDLIEIKYYEPRIVQTVTARLDTVAQKYDVYIEELEDRLAQYALEPSVSSYIEREATEAEAEERGLITGKLFDSVPGLEGIRIVEQNGTAVHFSTYSQDVLSESEELIAYSDYTKLNEIPFYIISSPDNGSNAKTKELMVKRCQIYFDSAKERLIFSLPYFDKFTAYRGSILFYVSGDDFMRLLINDNVVSLNTRCVLIAPKDTHANTQSKKNCGVVFDIPFTGKESIKEEIRNKWSKDLFGLEQLVRNENSEETLVLITSQVSKYAQMGWVCDEDDFSFSNVERILILLCVFITVFLIVFLLFNIKHDDMTVIRGRVKKFQKALLTEYVERRNASDWKELTKELNVRRQDVNDEIKKSLGKRGKKHSKEVDELLDASWNELFAAVGGRAPVAGIASADAAAVGVAAESVAAVEVVASDVEEVSAVEEVEDLEEVEALEEVESVEEVEALEEVESLEEVETSVDEVEPLEEVAAVDEVETSVDEVEPLEEVAAVDEVEPLDEVEAVEEIEPCAVEEVESAEEITDLEEVETLDEVEAVEEVEVLDEVEAAEDVVAVEESETVEEAAAVDEVEPLEDAEVVEEIDGADDVEADAIEEEAAVVGEADGAIEDIAVTDDSTAEEESAVEGELALEGESAVEEEAPALEEENPGLGEEQLALEKETSAGEEVPTAEIEEAVAEDEKSAFEEELASDTEESALEEKLASDTEESAIEEESPALEEEELAPEEEPSDEEETVAVEIEETVLEEDASAEEESSAEIEVPVVAKEEADDESYKAESRAMQASIDDLIARLSGSREDAPAEEESSLEEPSAIATEPAASDEVAAVAEEVPAPEKVSAPPARGGLLSRMSAIAEASGTSSSVAAPKKKSLLGRAALMRDASVKEESGLDDEMQEVLFPKKTTKVDEKFAENFFVVTPDFSVLDENSETDGSEN